MSTNTVPLTSDISRKFKNFCERRENGTLCADLQSLNFLYNTPAVSNFECQSIVYYPWQ